MKQLGIVFKFEFGNIVKKKPYIVMIAVLVLIAAIALSWPRISSMFSDNSATNIQKQENTSQSVTNTNEGKRFALLDEADGKAGDAKFYNDAYMDSDIVFIEVNGNKDELEKQVADGEFEALIILRSPLEYSRIVHTVEMFDTFPVFFEEIMLVHYRQQTLEEYGVPEAVLEDILSAGITGELITTSGGKNQLYNFFYAYVMIFLLYFALVMYGSMVSTSVATEKSTRAMELLITSTRPNSLMFGKVLGASLAGLMQLFIVIASAYLFYSLNSAYYVDNQIIKSVFEIPVSMLFYLAVFFLLGFLLYAFLYASLASLVSRMEDLATSIMPVTLLFVAAFMVVMISMGSGNIESTLMIACSFIPLSSPMAMFTRIVMSEVPVYQVLLSIAVLLISTIGVGLLAAKIYRLGVLLYGTPPKIKQIIKMLKSEKTRRI